MEDNKEVLQSKYITFYSCERFDKNNGRGGAYQTKVIYKDDDDFKEQKRALKEENRLKNIDYRTNNPLSQKRGNTVDHRFKAKLNQTGVNYTNLDILQQSVRGVPDMALDHALNADFRKGSGNSFVLIASSKNGKTELMKRIYHKYFVKDVPKSRKLHSILFSINSFADVYKDLNVTKCNKFDASTAKLINQLKKVNEITDNKYNFLIMTDDIIDMKYSKTISDLVLTLRNANMSSILSVQYPFLLSKSCRSSLNNLCCGGLNTDEAIESLIKSFLQSKFVKMGFKTMPSQIALYRRLTEDYHFIYVFSRQDVMVRFKIDLSDTNYMTASNVQIVS